MCVCGFYLLGCLTVGYVLADSCIECVSHTAHKQPLMSCHVLSCRKHLLDLDYKVGSGSGSTSEGSSPPESLVFLPNTVFT